MLYLQSARSKQVVIILALVWLVVVPRAWSQSCDELSNLLAQEKFLNLVVSEIEETQVSRKLIRRAGAAKSELNQFQNCSYLHLGEPRQDIFIYSCQMRQTLPRDQWNRAAVDAVADKIRVCLPDWKEEPEHVAQAKNKVFSLTKDGAEVSLSLIGGSDATLSLSIAKTIVK